MKKTEYLYDLDPTLLKDMKYEDAIRYKILHANNLIARLMDVHWSGRDDERVSSVHKAIKFNEKLLKELS